MSFFYCFFFTTDESQSRNPFYYSKSFQCHTVLISLGLKVLPLRQFDLSYDTISSATSFGLQQILELFLDFCVKVNNENLESETDFWEILAVLLLAWYLPFSFCYFCMWSAHHTHHTDSCIKSYFLQMNYWFSAWHKELYQNVFLKSSQMQEN